MRPCVQFKNADDLRTCVRGGLGRAERSGGEGGAEAPYLGVRLRSPGTEREWLDSIVERFKIINVRTFEHSDI